MKTTINIIIASALLAVATSATAKSWRINNNAAAAPDFASINEAMNNTNVTAGDTLYLDPGFALSGDQTVTKQVTIIGAGYNSNLPYGWSSLTGKLILSSAGIKVESVYLYGGALLKANNIHLERCYIVNRYGSFSYSGTAQSIIIRQCYLTGNSSGNGVIAGAGKTELNTANWRIENCIIYPTDYPNAITGLYGAVIQNNYITNKYGNNSCCVFGSISNCTVKNNIIVNRYNKEAMFSDDTDDCVIQYNVLSCSQDQYPTLSDTNQRIGSNTETDYFVMSGSVDVRFELSENSPAKDAGVDGVDCGPFGGDYPYVMGGLPMGHPYYTKAIIPAKSKNGKINVSLKIKMQNE